MSRRPAQCPLVVAGRCCDVTPVTLYHFNISRGLCSFPMFAFGDGWRMNPLFEVVKCGSW